MKALHLFENPKDKRGFLKLIMVKDGYVYSTDGFAFVVIPVNEVFGTVFEEPVVDSEETLFFKKADWKKSKAFEAFSFQREKDVFHALAEDGSKLGPALYPVKDVKDEFPDLDALLMLGEPNLFGFGINADLVDRIGDVLGCATFALRRRSLDVKMPTLLFPNNGSAAVAGLMGLENEPPYINKDNLKAGELPAEAIDEYAGLSDQAIAMIQDQREQEGLSGPVRNIAVDALLQRVAELEEQLKGSAVEHLENELIEVKEEHQTLLNSIGASASSGAVAFLRDSQEHWDRLAADADLKQMFVDLITNTEITAEAWKEHLDLLKLMY